MLVWLLELLLFVKALLNQKNLVGRALLTWTSVGFFPGGALEDFSKFF